MITTQRSFSSALQHILEIIYKIKQLMHGMCVLKHPFRALTDDC